MRFEVHPVNPQARIVKLAAAALEDDGLVLYPTESGYAIGCNAESPKAIHKLYALKKPMKKFFIDNFAFNIMKPRVPGPYTFILPADPHIARRLDVKRPEIGVRMPTHPFFKELFQHFDKPILSTAAKLSEEDIYEPDEIWKTFEHSVEMMVDCGPIEINPTNIISLIGGNVEVIRGELLDP